MEIYIDESGNLGRSGRYFIIAYLIPRTKSRLKNAVKHCRRIFGSKKQVDGKPLGELKGFDLSFEERQMFLNKITQKDDFEFGYIVADKAHLEEKLLEHKNICFNYLAGHLLKTTIQVAKEDIFIICDNRDIKVTSGKSLEEYLKIQAYSKWGFKHNLSLSYADSRKYNHLQCVDVISNTVSGRYMLNLGHCYGILRKHCARSIRFPDGKFGL